MQIRPSLIACLALLLASGCSRRPLPVEQGVETRAAARSVAVADEPRRKVRAGAAHASAGIEPILVLQRSQAWRAGWKAAPTDIRTIGFAVPAWGADPSTTGSIAPRAAAKPAPGYDAFAVMERLIDRGGKAAPLICRGC